MPDAWYPTRHDRNWRYLTEALEKLDAGIQGADAAPSPDLREGVARIGPFVDAVQQAWERLVKEDLAALNRKLIAAGEPAIELP